MCFGTYLTEPTLASTGRTYLVLRSTSYIFIKKCQGTAVRQIEDLVDAQIFASYLICVVYLLQ